MRYSKQTRERIATEYDAYAAASTRTADDLASRGHTIAAEIHSDQAIQYQRIADAARTSSAELHYQLTDEHNVA